MNEQQKHQFIFTYWNSCSKVIQVIEAQTLSLAVRVFLTKKVSLALDSAITFKVKKVLS